MLQRPCPPALFCFRPARVGSVWRSIYPRRAFQVLLQEAPCSGDVADSCVRFSSGSPAASGARAGGSRQLFRQVVIALREDCPGAPIGQRLASSFVYSSRIFECSKRVSACAAAAFGLRVPPPASGLNYDFSSAGTAAISMNSRRGCILLASKLFSTLLAS